MSCPTHVPSTSNTKHSCAILFAPETPTFPNTSKRSPKWAGVSANSRKNYRACCKVAFQVARATLGRVGAAGNLIVPRPWRRCRRICIMHEDRCHGCVGSLARLIACHRRTRLNREWRQGLNSLIVFRQRSCGNQGQVQLKSDTRLHFFTGVHSIFIDLGCVAYFATATEPITLRTAVRSR